MNSLPILYSFRRCPYAMRARLALSAAHIECELREVVLKDKPKAMLAISPKATVPVLQLNHGQVIEESLEVMLWALGRHDPLGLLDNYDANLVAYNDNEFKTALDSYKYYAGRQHEEGMPTQKDYRNQCEQFFQKLEDLLAGPFLSGDKPGLNDIAIMPFVRQCAFVDKAWFDTTRYTRTQAWLERWLASNWFNGVMQKYPQWQADSPPLPVRFTGAGFD